MINGVLRGCLKNIDLIMHWISNEKGYGSTYPSPFPMKDWLDLSLDIFMHIKYDAIVELKALILE